MNLSLRQLKVFLGVAETRNFTKAAQRLHISQAALSSAIRELEAQLDCSLFERTTRSVVLTEAGEHFVATAQAVVQALDMSVQDLREMRRHQRTRLLVGFTPTLAAHLAPDVLQVFHAEQPEVVVEIVDDSPHRLQERVEAGEIDAAFGAFFLKASGIDIHPVAASTLVLVHARSISAIGAEFDWGELHHYPLIALSDASPIQQLVQSTLKKAETHVQIRMTANHIETTIALAEKGFGVTITPSFATAVCRRYAVGVAQLVPAVRFNFCRIMKQGRTANDSLERLTHLVVEALRLA